MSPPGGRDLTADEYSALFQHAAELRAGRPDIEALVDKARIYRSRGASWAAIAAAYGIGVDLLRDWRGAVVDLARPPNVTLSPPSGRTLLRRLQPPPAVASTRTIVFAAGHPAPGGNDFASEAALIRGLVRPHGVEVVERFNIQLAELRRDLDHTRPAVVHLAAHHGDGGIALSVGSRPSIVVPDDIGRAVRTSSHRPALVVLACCHSDQPARQLAGRWAGPSPGAETAIGWLGQVTDQQTGIFAAQFYPYLAAGVSVGDCFADARLTITARWPDMATPELHGDGSSTPLRQP